MINGTEGSSDCCMNAKTKHIYKHGALQTNLQQQCLHNMIKNIQHHHEHKNDVILIIDANKYHQKEKIVLFDK